MARRYRTLQVHMQLRAVEDRMTSHVPPKSPSETKKGLRSLCEEHRSPERLLQKKLLEHKAVRGMTVKGSVCHGDWTLEVLLEDVRLLLTVDESPGYLQYRPSALKCGKLLKELDVM